MNDLVFRVLPRAGCSKWIKDFLNKRHDEDDFNPLQYKNIKPWINTHTGVLNRHLIVKTITTAQLIKELRTRKPFYEMFKYLREVL